MYIIDLSSVSKPITVTLDRMAVSDLFNTRVIKFSGRVPLLNEMFSDRAIAIPEMNCTPVFCKMWA